MVLANGHNYEDGHFFAGNFFAVQAITVTKNLVCHIFLGNAFTFFMPSLSHEPSSMKKQKTLANSIWKKNNLRLMSVSLLKDSGLNEIL